MIDVTHFPTNLICIEGPDLSGKTTLYNNIHKMSGFKWNIQDRSFLSMICYARQYGRDLTSHRIGLHRELTNLNNRLIVLLPSRETLLKRLKIRGDEFQDTESIIDLRDIFEDEVALIDGLPNVLVCRDELIDTAEAIKWLESIEMRTISQVGQFARDFIKESPTDSETLDVDLLLSPLERFSKVLQHPREGAYYHEIVEKVWKVINDELCGRNPYNLRQSLDSRRFYYSSSSCLSSVHFLVKGGWLQGLATLRSTDVDRNASIDLRFLCHLMTYISRRFDWSVDRIDLRVRFNCAHVRKDLSEWNKDTDVE